MGCSAMQEDRGREDRDLAEHERHDKGNGEGMSAHETSVDGATRQPRATPETSMTQHLVTHEFYPSTRSNSLMNSTNASTPASGNAL